MNEDDFINAYREISKVPDLFEAQITSINSENGSENIAIEATWQSRDLARLKTQLLKGHYLLHNGHVTNFPLVPECDNVVLHRLSPSGRRRARVLQGNNLSIIQVVGSQGQLSSFDLLEKNQHGNVYCDPYISCLEWSSDETKIAFVAEQKRQKATTHYCQNVDENSCKGEKHLFIDDWGEQMIGQHKGVVVSLDIDSGTLTTLPLPDDLTPGELLWVPKTQDIIGVANVSRPYKIGLAYCSDRESIIFRINQEGKYEELTAWGLHVKAPRFDSSGENLIYQKSFIFGDRAPAAQLWKLNMDNEKEELILDYVNDCVKVNNGDFRGLCGKSIFPRRCFDSSDKKIIVSAFNLSTIELYVVDLANKSVSVIHQPESCIILDVCDDWLLLSKTTIAEPKRLFIAKLPSNDANYSLQLIPITAKTKAPSIEPSWYQLFEHSCPNLNASGQQLKMSSLYFGPTSNQKGEIKRPLICWPHGGPHSLTPNSFGHLRAYFVSIGYSMVLPNYRGSIGHGNDFLSSSLGQAGEEDVHDCYLSIQECLQRFPDVIDENKIFLIGISHGGTITGQMTAKYPERFCAAGLLNPALDIYIMATASDIPEWAYLEYGLPFHIGRTMDKKSAMRMFDRSPVHAVDNVKTPSIICLGTKDVRVPPCQGLNYYKLLLAKNIPTRLYVYEDNHPLLKISSESDYVIQIAKWFKKYT